MRERSIVAICWVAFWANLGLSIFKISMGALGYSPLLLIDGLSSAAIAIMVATIVLGVEMGGEATVSARYSYGKGKAQFLVSLLLGTLVAVSAAVVLGLAVQSFFHVPAAVEPVALGLAVALVSIASGVAMLAFLRQAGARHRNTELPRIARLQSLSIAISFVVAQGLVFMALGWPIAQQMGSLSISFLVLWLSFRIIRSSVDGIIDTRSGHGPENAIRAVVASVPEVQEVQWVRTRRLGACISIDVGVGLDGHYRVSQSDQVSERIRYILFEKMEQPLHVISVECRAM
jgi:cation diffusion facilitator family transporter